MIDEIYDSGQVRNLTFHDNKNHHRDLKVTCDVRRFTCDQDDVGKSFCHFIENKQQLIGRMREL